MGALVVAALTLTPSLNEHMLRGFCLVCGELGGQDFLDNVLLFVPLALGLRLSGVRTWRAVAIAFAASGTIELLQRWVIPGRDASVGDLLANTLGGGVGALLGAWWRTLILPDPPRARRLAAAGAAAWVAVLAATAWTLQRTVPRSPTGYDVHWTPEDFPGERYGGRVLSVAVGDVPLVPGRLSEAAVRGALDADSIRFSATFTAGAARRRGSEVIARVATPDSVPVLVFARRGCDLALEARTRVHDARLRPPNVAVEGVLPCGANAAIAKLGDTLRATGVLTTERLRLTVGDARGGEARGASAPISPVLGWSFFLPWYVSLDGSRRLLHALSALWLGGLLVPVGYWVGRSRDRDGARRGGVGPLLLSLGAVVVGLAIVPLLAGLAASAASDWAASIAGVALGWLVGAWSSTGRRAAAAPTSDASRA
ncbi:MAG TPA: VanZ family protein [Gemmatimonadaceae bacterium]|nr:VanZ family protein [Gemmatimonadaceae bacterium]